MTSFCRLVHEHTKPQNEELVIDIKCCKHHELATSVASSPTPRRVQPNPDVFHIAVRQVWTGGPGLG